MSDELLEQSQSLRADFFERQSELLEKLTRDGQRPEALFVGCSDSRVTPGALFAAEPGRLFMVRNIANMIPPASRADDATQAALEFAILHLHVPHLIVCGHTQCGGIKALSSPGGSLTPALARWLEHARETERKLDFAGSALDHEERHRALVEANVVAQLRNAQTHPFVQKALEADELELHGWVYDLVAQRMASYDPTTGTFEMEAERPS